MKDAYNFNKVMDEIKELQDSYGGKPYSSLQINLIYEYAQKVPLGVFKKACRNLVSHCRYKPMPMEFKSELSSYLAEKRQSEDTPETKIDCEQCYDTGLCFIKDKFDILVRCHCSNGNARTEFFPQLDKYDPRDPFPLKNFIPDVDPESKTACIDEKIRWWRDMLDISKAYWNDKVNGGSR